MVESITVLKISLHFPLFLLVKKNRSRGVRGSPKVDNVQQQAAQEGRWALALLRRNYDVNLR